MSFAAREFCRGCAARFGDGMMMTTDREDLTELLIAWGEGNEQARDELLHGIYDELRALAACFLRGERPDHVLQPTALVHDAYLRLVDQKRVAWQDRAHFFGFAARIMRQILVDHARRRAARKRGGDRAGERLSLSGLLAADGERPIDAIELDEGLERLAELDERQARIVELRFYTGLSVEETAVALDTSESTVKREWRLARAWLLKWLRGEGRR